jgi:hypothetical protein
MTEEKLDKVFHALRTEAPETLPLEVEAWISQPSVIQIDRSLIYRRIFFSVLIGIGLIAGYNRFKGNTEPMKARVSNVVPAEKKWSDKQDKGDDQKGSIAKTDRNVTTGASIPKVQIQMQQTPIYTDEVSPFPILRPRNVQQIPYWLKDLSAQSGKQQRRDVLIILDSVQTYRKPPRFLMDESDCYVQIYGDYAVISYRVRNTNYYWGGRIHNEEVVEIDGKNFNVFAFQSDNNAAVTNFGGRVFFGYREDPLTNRIEVIKFSQPWAPDKVFTSHMASPKERQHLVERSNSQKNF